MSSLAGSGGDRAVSLRDVRPRRPELAQRRPANIHKTQVVFQFLFFTAQIGLALLKHRVSADGDTI